MNKLSLERASEASLALIQNLLKQMKECLLTLMGFGLNSSSFYRQAWVLITAPDDVHVFHSIAP